jgi:hypothetical protein
MPTRSKRSSTPAGLGPFLKRAVALGAARAKLISASRVTVGEWVRWKCQFGCGCYGTLLTCPPYSPAPEDTARMLRSYRRAILLEGGARPVKQIVPDLEREVFLAGFHKAFGMACGPCRLCKSSGSPAPVASRSGPGPPWKPAAWTSSPLSAPPAGSSGWCARKTRRRTTSAWF